MRRTRFQPNAASRGQAAVWGCVAAMLLLTLLLPPARASAAEAVAGIRYKPDASGNAIITGFTGAGGTVAIPPAIDAYPVTEIGDSAFRDATSLERVELPDTLTRVGQSAFSGCVKLERIELPDSVSTIGPGAFSGCAALSGVKLPEGLTVLNPHIFAGCGALAEITLPESLEAIGRHAFSDCLRLGWVEIPPATGQIDVSAFRNCVMLTIRGCKDSYAQRYAVARGIRFDPVSPAKQLILRLAGGTEAIKTLTMDLLAEERTAALRAEAVPPSPWPRFSWQSSAPDIASVDAEGRVTTLSEGTAVITARAEDGGGKKASCKVRVVCLAMEIIVSGDDALASGRSARLVAAVLPGITSDKRVAWSSSDEGIAAVSASGVVKAQPVAGPATAVITAAAQDGSGVSAAFRITIYPAAREVTILHDGTPVPDGAALLIDLTSGPGMLKLSADVAPASAMRGVVWKSSGPGTASIDDTGLVMGLKEGAVTITATAGDGGGAKAACRVRMMRLVGEIVLSGKNALVAGEQTRLSAQVLPENASSRKLDWSSSDEGVATVSASGVVKALPVTAPATAVITAEAQDGSGVLGSMEITVSP